MRVIKLTNRDGYSRRGLPGETLWLPVGREVKPTGEGSDQCGPGVLHYFASEVEASLYWPTYLLDESAARALSVEVESVETDGIKLWSPATARVLEEVELPKITVDERAAFAVCVAPHEVTRDWAIGWLTGADRTQSAAEAASTVAWTAAQGADWAAARAAARAAAWAAAARAAALGAAREAAQAAAWSADAAWMKVGGATNPWPFHPKALRAFARGRAILAGRFPAERYAEDVEPTP